VGWLAVLAGCSFDPNGPSSSGPPVDARSPDDARDASDGKGSDTGVGSQIAFVQLADTSNDSTMPKVVTTAFDDPQLAHDLDIVMVCWQDPDEHPTPTVADSSGNPYQVAVGPQFSGNMNQLIFYSCDIAGSGSNVVTVELPNQTQSDVRIAEYSGLRGSGCLDQTAFDFGDQVDNDSGSAVTTAADELLLATNCTFAKTLSGEASFTNRIITEAGNIVEDDIVSTADSYEATATQDASADWVMQMVTFFGK
jgi:hypothetical protein